MKKTLNAVTRGFTMIELIVVIAILGIIGLIAIPKYFDFTSQAKLSTLKGQLGTIRAAVSLGYANSALSGSPEFPSLNATIFADGIVPVDPYDNASTVEYVTSDPISTSDVTGTEGGWLYNKTTGEVRPNNSTYFNY